MSLALRLLVAFALVALGSTAAVGWTFRGASRRVIEEGYAQRFAAAVEGVKLELGWEIGEVAGLLRPLCEHDAFVDRTLVELERQRAEGGPGLDPGRRLAIQQIVPEQRKALRLDELLLVTGDGEVLGAHDPAHVGTLDPRLASLLRAPPGAPRLRPTRPEGAPASLETHCARSSGGVTIGLLGARRVEPILRRVGDAYGVELALDTTTPAPASSAHDPHPERAGDARDEVRIIDLREVAAGLSCSARISRAPLRAALAELDRQILVTGSLALGAAGVLAILLAKSLSRPIVALARETREVVAGDPHPVRARGGRELRELAEAFNRTLDELAAMRRRLAATERIAARREIARRIAHEIKNPLAPIRAAVETLRRLRERGDPAFDDYFDEATRTVLDEVHRIAHIVGEFTRFARLPPPSPEPLDLPAVARGVVTLHAATGEVSLVTRGEIPPVLADRDQVVQVLTNLIQNGLEAAREVRPDPRVLVTIEAEHPRRVRLVVRDNGPGVSEAILPRLFEPYATGKATGTGLGLAIVHRIVFEHGGEIRYRAASKGGAVFELWLPLDGPPLLDRPPEVTATGSREGGGAPAPPGVS